MITEDPSSEVQSETAISTLEKVRQTVLPLMERLVKSKARTYEDYLALVDTAASLGVPSAPQNSPYGMDLRNYQPVMDFCNAVKAGEDAQTAIYFIAADSVAEYQFSVQSKQMTLTITDWPFYHQKPGVTKEELDTLTLWDNGWMIWHNKNDDSSGSFSGLRVQPLGEEAYRLREENVLPFNHTPTGMLSLNWDVQHLNRLNWDFIYQCLLEREKTHNNAYGVSREAFTGPNATVFPAAEVEGLMMRYFPITADQLRRLPAYDSDTQTYAFWGFRGGGYCSAMEITEKKENPDGSLTLRVDVFAPEFNVEHEYTNYLTILPNEYGGYRYISNVTDCKKDETANWKDGNGSGGFLTDSNE